MMKIMLCTAALALSMFVGSATAAPATSTRIEASGGSYGFLYHGSCPGRRCPRQCVTYWQRYYDGIPASMLFPQWCANMADTSKRTSGDGVFSRGKFRST